MDRFLVVHDVPRDVTEASFHDSLRALDMRATTAGLVVEETFYNLNAAKAYSVIRGDTSAHVRDTCERAGLPAPDVTLVHRVFTELLHEPRRARYA